MVWFQHIWHLFNPLPPPVVALGVFQALPSSKGFFIVVLGAFSSAVRNDLETIT